MYEKNDFFTGAGHLWTWHGGVWHYGRAAGYGARCRNTPDSTYRLSDEVFLYVYLLSNRAIANIYKIIKDD